MGTSQSSAEEASTSTRHSGEAPPTTSSAQNVRLSSKTMKRYTAITVDAAFVIRDIDNPVVWDETFAALQPSFPRIPELDEVKAPMHEVTGLTSDAAVGMPLVALLGSDAHATFVEVLSTSQTSVAATSSGAKPGHVKPPITLRWRPDVERYESGSGVRDAPEFVLFVEPEGHTRSAAKRKKPKSSALCFAPTEEEGDDSDGEDAARTRMRRYRQSANQDGDHGGNRTMWILPAHLAATEVSLLQHAPVLHQCVQCNKASLNSADRVYTTQRILLPFLAGNGNTLLHNISLTTCSTCLASLRSAVADCKTSAKSHPVAMSGASTGSLSARTPPHGHLAAPPSLCGESEIESQGSASAIMEFFSPLSSQGEASPTGSFAGSSSFRRPNNNSFQGHAPIGNVGAVKSTSRFARRSTSTAASTPKPVRRQPSLSSSSAGSPTAFGATESSASHFQLDIKTYSSSDDECDPLASSAARSSTSGKNRTAAVGIVMVQDKALASAFATALGEQGLVARNVTTVKELLVLLRTPGMVGVIVVSVLYRGVNVTELLRHLRGKAAAGAIASPLPLVVGVGPSSFSAVAISAGCSTFVAMQANQEPESSLISAELSRVLPKE